MGIGDTQDELLPQLENAAPTGARVLVVGAGPVGLFTALCLARRGIPVRILERSASTKLDPRAAVIWQRTALALSWEGLAPAFEAHMAPLQSAELYVRGRKRATIALGEVACQPKLPWIIEQHVVERLLVQALSKLGVEVEWGMEATQIVDEGALGRVHVTNSAGKTESVLAEYVVAADGSRSPTRKALGVEFEGAPHPRIECRQLNAKPSWRYAHVPGRCRFFIEAGATLLAVPLPDGGYRFVNFVRTPAVADASDTLGISVEELERSFRILTHDPKLSLAPTEPRWLSRARFQDRVASRLRVGRILLVGDAAHVWTPVGGRGMNLGLLGAHNLAWRLAAVLQGEREEWLDGYDEEQRRWARGVIQRLQLNRTEYPSAPWELALVDAAMPFAAQFGPIKRRIELELSALGLEHRKSSWTQRGVSAGATRAGDLFPGVLVELECREVSGHELISPGWTLVALGTVDEPSHVPAGLTLRRVRALVPEAVRALGTRGRFLLLRPDGHVALIARSGRFDEVLRYYKERFTGPPNADNI